MSRLQRRRLVLPRNRKPGFGNIAALGTVNSIANASTATFNLSAGQGRAVGDAVIVGVQYNSTGTINSVSDSVGNAYGGPIELNMGGALGKLRLFRSVLTKALPDNGSITASFSIANTNSKNMVIGAVSGVNAVDKTLDGATATSANPSLNLGQLAEDREIVFALLRTNAAAVTAEPTVPDTWTALQTLGTVLELAYVITNSPADVTPQWTLASSVLWGLQMISYTEAR